MPVTVVACGNWAIWWQFGGYHPVQAGFGQRDARLLSAFLLGPTGLL